jgi:spore maturation protein CgeB
MSPDPIHLQTKLPQPRRVLTVTDLVPGSTADYRTRALRRLGQQLTVFNVKQYDLPHRRLNALRSRIPFGPWIAKINRELLAIIEQSQPEIVVFDKPILFSRETIACIKGTGAKIVFYVQDGPFGPRRDGCWRQFYRTYQLADLHCLFREADVRRYAAWGLPFLKLLFSYEPSVLFPPPAAWSDADRDREISYIGHPHEDRPAFLMELGERFHLPISVSGNRWPDVLTAEQQRKYLRDGFLQGAAYRDGIWKSKVNVSFVTQCNEDDIAHKAIEIAASGGFLLALRTGGHRACFEEDREAVFFASLNECAEKAVYYLARPTEREAIARQGHLRAITSGYSNDTQLAQVLNYFG